MNSRFPALPQSAVTASDVVALYLHRGAFENALADEDQEQDPDRWVSHTALGQECWQIVSQWVPEPPSRTRASASSCSGAHHRVCSSTPHCTQGVPRAGSCSGVRTSRSRSAQDRRPLLGARFCPPAGWDAALSSKPITGGTRAAKGAPMAACAWSMPEVTAVAVPGRMPRAVSMECQRHREAASSECALASIGHRVSPHPLEGLEPEAASAGMYATPSSSTRGGAGRTGSCCRSNAPTRAPVPCTARALSSRLSRAARAPRASSSSEPGDDPTVRRRRRLCHLAREGSGLTPL